MSTQQREKFSTRVITLVGEVQRETALALVRNVPLDAIEPLELVVREKIKTRKLDQNALMWAGPLADIAEQGYCAGRTYSAEVWHHYFKTLYLPDGYDAQLCKSENYRKWDYTPNWERVLVGSTGDLTVKGFALYLTQIEAFGADMGVMFHANPNDARRAA